MRIEPGRSDTVREEHPQLTAAVDQVVACLRALPGALGSSDGKSVWGHHLEFAERATHLAAHLEAAVSLSDRHPSSAFVVLRTAMEQACVDELLLLADRYRERIKVEPAVFEALREEFDSGTADWSSNVVTFERAKGGAVLVRTGHSVVNNEGEVVEQVSPYYPVLEHHDALLGPPDSQADVAEAFADPDRLRDWARRNRGLYRNYLRWSAVVDNLVLNGRLHEQDAIRLEVHYRFLSAFVHATGTGYDLVNPGRTHSYARQHTWHLVTELTLVYACSAGISELRAFSEFADRRPRVHLANRADVDAICDTVGELTSYLWYPRIGRPMPYDYVEEANRRAHQRRGEGEWPRPEALPNSIPAAEVGYYHDPLKRLALLHTGGNEMSTGLGHAALW